MAVLEAGQSEVFVIAKVNAVLDRHASWVRIRPRSERAILRVFPNAGKPSDSWPIVEV